MRLTTIEDVREKRRESLKEKYLNRSLSRIRLSSKIGEASIDGFPYRLSGLAVKQMCQMLNIPLNFAVSLSEKMPDIWEELQKRLTRESSKRVTLKIDPQQAAVLGLFTLRDDYITLWRFLYITERIYEAMADFSGVKNLVVDVNHESSTAFFYTPKEFAPIRKDFTDIFRYGVGFSASSIEMYSPSISESLFRLICTNMTYAPAFGGVRFRSRNEERILSAVGVILEDSSRVSRYSNMLSNLTEQMLSYREAEEVYMKILSIKDGEGESVVDAEHRIPLRGVAQAYGYEYLQRVPSSPSWKATARTPVSAYHALNALTEIGSNCQYISEKTRLDMLMHAGKFMFKKKWDLDDLAPQNISFENLKKEARLYA